VDCLTGYVGLRGCSQGTPGSGLIVNSLPGMPMELLQSIVTGDTLTVQAQWEEVEQTAQAELLIDTTALFNQRYQLNHIARSFDIGRDVDLTDVTAAGAVYRGALFELDRDVTSGYTRSNLMLYSMDSFSIYLSAATTAALAFKIYDKDKKTVLGTYSLAVIDQVVGWNTVAVNELFTVKSLAIVYEATEVNSVALTLPSYLSDGFCDCMESLYGNECNGEIQGISTPDLTGIDTLTEGTNTFGLTLNLTLVCNYEGFICANKMSFARLYQYLLGAKVLDYTLYSPRFSQFNAQNRKIYSELRDRFHSDYLTSLAALINGTNLDVNDPCLACNSEVVKRFVSP
jgi:hypothetical protein